MISDLDTHRAANLVISRHGSDALVEAARMVDRMLELGDPDGQAVSPHPSCDRGVAGEPERGGALGRVGVLLNALLWNIVKLPLAAR